MIFRRWRGNFNSHYDLFNRIGYDELYHGLVGSWTTLDGDIFMASLSHVLISREKQDKLSSEMKIAPSN